MFFLRLSRENVNEYIEDILDLYISVYSAPPRYEIINREEIKYEIQNSFNKQTITIIAIDNGLVIGLSSAMPAIYLKDFIKMSKESIELAENENAFFHTEAYVAENYRGKKIGSSLFNIRKTLILNETNENKIFTRTRADAIAQNNLLKKENFNKIASIEIKTNNVISIKDIWSYSIS